ncbi:MAG: hypothetical protein QXE82_00195 [Candidatus Nitrosotenuis sp.]
MSTTCNKCGGTHKKTEILYDRNEYKLIDTLEKIRQTHKIKVTSLLHDYEGDSEMHTAKIKYLDMEDRV